MNQVTGQCPPGALTIDPADERQCRVWAEQLGVTTEEVRGAIAAVGSNAEDVLVHLFENSAGPLGGIDPAP